MRVLLSVPVSVRGLDVNRKNFQEETKTLVVNAHGALILIASQLKAGQTITVTNLATKAMLDCRVVYHGQAQGGRTQVGIEFLQPSPSFWQVNFPPEDWKSVSE